jgi:hypothetical protein
MGGIALSGMRAFALVAALLALAVASCGGGEGGGGQANTVTAGATTSSAAAKVEAQCAQAFRRYDALIRTYENSVEAGPNEEPYQRATLRQCNRSEWLTQAELYRDTVVLVEPLDVLDAMCGEPRSTLPACR